MLGKDLGCLDGGTWGELVGDAMMMVSVDVRQLSGDEGDSCDCDCGGGGGGGEGDLVAVVVELLCLVFRGLIKVVVANMLCLVQRVVPSDCWLLLIGWLVDQMRNTN